MNYLSSIILFVCVFHLVQSENVKCLSNLKDGQDQTLKFNNITHFTDAMCAQCYYILGELTQIWKNRTFVDINMFPIYSPTVRLCFPKKINDVFHINCFPFSYSGLKRNDTESDLYLSQFRHQFHLDLFLKCCEEAKQCCEKMQDLDDTEISEDGSLCPAKWDGWMCWDSAKPGTTSWKICPDMSFSVLGYMPTECSKEYATKECYKNGTWSTIWTNETGNMVSKESTNYMKCSTPGATERLRETHTAIVVYFISLIFSITGSTIFIVYKQYNILRVKIHLNFLCSLILTCFFSILFFFLVREKHYKLESMIEDNLYWCKALVVLHKGARLANFCWMLNEGVYLHQLIVAAFREQRRTIYYYLFGWGTPIIIMIPYVGVHSIPKYDNSCWTKSMLWPELLYNLLPLICIVINAFLLANVVRVLMTKLRQSPDHFRAGLRASIVLLPIFGIQYTFYVVPIDPFDSCNSSVFVARYIQIVIEALQGAIVTTIFCFLNGEVHSHIRRTIRRRFPKISEVVTESQVLERTT